MNDTEQLSKNAENTSETGITTSLERHHHFLAFFLLAVALLLGALFFYLRMSTKTETDIVADVPPYPEDGYSVYANAQNAFSESIACGVTDFASPYVKPVACDSEKAQKGEPLTIGMKGSVVTKDGEGLAGVKMTVNDGEPFYTNELGFFDTKITIDSNKKLINLVGDKFGFSPIRATYNAQVPIKNGSAYEIPEVYTINIVMREVETQYVTIVADQETHIVSNQVEGVELLIPANGLVKINGETVVGEVAVEMTYLDPESNPEDIQFVPGFNGNTKQMIAVDRNGEQVILVSGGMLLIHITQGDSREFFQPREGVEVTLTMPMNSFFVTSSNKGIFTEEELEGFSEEFKAAMQADPTGLAWNHWFYNEHTGLWEEWPGTGDLIVNEEAGTYSINVARFN